MIVPMDPPGWIAPPTSERRLVSAVGKSEQEGKEAASERARERKRERGRGDEMVGNREMEGTERESGGGGGRRVGGREGGWEGGTEEKGEIVRL